ncbi:hypothetical protein NPIL_543041 [Nephila pilipes]|uniref:Uncharacterized protein n=1 Tax=Nephila pilipes TaxID=299642 RepID=A0A8X6QKC3_NEPPI|nr:hypothetical protein NPIL_543041 [Nephila pilipes]
MVLLSTSRHIVENEVSCAVKVAHSAIPFCRLFNLLTSRSCVSPSSNIHVIIIDDFSPLLLSWTIRCDHLTSFKTNNEFMYEA